MIPQNLLEALVELRLTEFVRVLWVDALCINQADSEEKSI
jgi:Heterokaryon incompatibility protein (HET)